MVIEVLDSIHAKVTGNRCLQAFTAFTRVLLAVGFIPPSIPKILHRPFTMLPDSNPVGHYFNALYQTGFYYEFIGWSQLLAAILLLIPRTSHIGAVMFLPIILNIAVLTCSVGFVGTWLITILMALAAAYLTAWEFDRFRPMFADRADRVRGSRMQFVAIPAFFALGGSIIAFLFSIFRIGNFNDYGKMALFFALIGAIFGMAVALHFRFMRTGKLLEKTG